MQKNLQALLNSLRIEKKSLEQERSHFESELLNLKRSRQTESRQCINEELLPDLKSGTIRALREAVPGFQVPMVSAWFGLSEKVDPKYSLNSLRMGLWRYLDNAEETPACWKERVADSDESIRHLQENLIQTNAEHLLDISARIMALEKLGKADLSKMDPKMRGQIEEALKAQTKKGVYKRRLPLPLPPRNSRVAPPPYPSAQKADSDSGPGLFELWLLYQLLTPHSEYSQEIQRMEAGGGEFGGAGASGNFSADIPPVSSAETDRTADVLVGAAVIESSAVPDSGDIDRQNDLGAKSFS